MADRTSERTGTAAGANPDRASIGGAVDVAELRRLLAGATPGPWFIERSGVVVDGPDETSNRDIAECRCNQISDDLAARNAALIVAARNALPSLLTELNVSTLLLSQARAALLEISRELAPKADESPEERVDKHLRACAVAREVLVSIGMSLKAGG